MRPAGDENAQFLPLSRWGGALPLGGRRRGSAPSGKGKRGPCAKGSRCRLYQGASATRPYGELQRVGDQCSRKIRQAPKRRRTSPTARHGKLDVPCVFAPIPGPAPTRLRSRPKVPKLTPCSDGRSHGETTRKMPRSSKRSARARGRSHCQRCAGTRAARCHRPGS